MRVEVKSVLLSVFELQEVVVKGLFGDFDSVCSLLKGQRVKRNAIVANFAHRVELPPLLDCENDLSNLAFLGPFKRFALLDVGESI